MTSSLDRYMSIDTRADALDRALAIHRQHLDAARRAIATNDNGAVRELLGELLGEPQSARRGEGDNTPGEERLAGVGRERRFEGRGS